MADLSFIIKSISGNSGMSLGVSPVKTEGTVRFVKSDSGDPNEITLITVSGSWPFTENESTKKVRLNTRSISGSTVSYTGNPMSVKSSYTGTYQFRTVSGGAIYQVAVAGTGNDEVTLNYYDTGKKLRIYQHAVRSSQTQAVLDFTEEGAVADEIKAERFDPPTAGTATASHVININQESTKTWTVTGLTSSTHYSWKLDVFENQTEMGVEVLGGSEGDIDLFPPD